MKYCKKCKHIYNDTDTLCEKCKKPLYDIEDDNTPVYLLSADGFELQRVRTAIEDNGIPCDAMSKKKSLSASAVTGYDTSECDLLVPFSAYEKAYDICVGIGAIKEDGTEIVDEPLDENGEPVKSAVEEFEEMSSTKRTTVRVVSALLLIVLAGGVIYLTDFVTNLIKNLF